MFNVSMYFQSLFSRLSRLVFLVAVCSTFYLYLYPVFHGCVFPSTDAFIATALRDTLRQHSSVRPLDNAHTPSPLAPFRLLVLADPQLEGDSSLPKPDDAFRARSRRHWDNVRNAGLGELRVVALDALREVALRDIPDALKALRKQVDLFGNDYYLAHIYRTMHWWAKPTHVTVLGDLIGSQWVTDEEFERRGWRYWNRVFAGGKRVEDEITVIGGGDEISTMSMTDAAWKHRIINIAGNHDIGYAGDISEARMNRFEKMYGNANWDVRFEYPAAENATGIPPTVHLIVLNSLILDTPALAETMQHQTYEYINSVITGRLRPVEDRTSFTLLLTHLPLHKKAGVCVDAPYFDYWGDDDGGGVYKPHGVREQYHLSEHGSHHGVLGGIFGINGDSDAPAGGRGRSGLILTGHDHEGCDVWHHLSTVEAGEEVDADGSPETKFLWDAVSWSDANSSKTRPGVREVTLRSMMGDFGGNAGLMSAWFDFVEGEWRYEIQMCKVGVQHIWWAVHTVDAIAVLLAIVAMSCKRSDRESSPQKTTIPGTNTEKIED